MPSPRPRSVKRHALTHDQPSDLATGCSERESHADLARALRDAEREHPVESDGRKQQRACANALSSTVLNRCGADASAITCAIVVTSATASAGSSRAIAARIGA